MLIGYVSDERYVALPEVLFEFTNGDNSWETRSRASGSVHLDLEPGEYTLTVEIALAGREPMTVPRPIVIVP